MTTPKLVLFWKNSTLAIVPSASLAWAWILMVAGAVKLVVDEGDVMATVGDRLAGGLTVMLTVVLVVTAPKLSVALAVSA